MAARTILSPNRSSAGGLLVALCALAPALSGQTQPASQQESPAPNSEPTYVLNPFEVGASSNVGYGAETTTSSGGVVQKYIDVPQTVNVLTSEFMYDFDLENSRDALATVPGVQVGGTINNGSNMIRGVGTNAFYIDGLQGNAANTIELGANIGGSFTMPIEFYDRIEVVKGPSSADFALGESGGAINYVSKTPEGLTRTDIAMGVGEYNNYKFTADAQGLSGKLSYRLIVDQEAGDSEVQWEHSSVTGAQLALKYQLDPKTTILSITSIEKEITPSYGVPSYDHDLAAAQADQLISVPGLVYNPSLYTKSNGIPAASLPYGFVGNTVGGPNTSWNTDTSLYFRSYLSLIHNFSDHASIRNALAIDNDVQEPHLTTPANGAYPVYNQPQPGEYGYQPVVLDFDSNSHGLSDSLTFVTDYDVLGGHWTTTAGGDYHRSEANETFSVDVPSVYYNIYDPGSIGNIDKYISMPAVPNVLWQEEKDEGYGFFGQEQASFLKDMITVLAGWRIDYLNETSINHLAGDSLTSTGWQNSKGATRLALTIKPTSWLSLYSLYSVHKDPSQLADLYNWFSAAPPPVANPAEKISYTPQGVLFEEGARVSLLNGKILGSFAIYHDINSGTIITPFVAGGYPDPTHPGVIDDYTKAIVTGANIHGVEATITGIVNDRLVFQAGMSYTRGYQPTILSGTINTGETASVYVNSLIHPADQVNFHGKYDFGDLHGNGLYATFGVNFFGPYPYYYTQATNWDLDYTGKPFSINYNSWQYNLGVGLGYRWSHGRQKIVVSCENLTDQYVDLGSEASGNQAVLSGRTVWLKYSLSY